MKIIKISLKKLDPEIIKITAKIIKNGGVVAMPFDTCYGLAADATNKEAVQKVYQIKKRSADKPISSVFKNIQMIKKYVKINKKQGIELKKYLPGPYTIILPARKSAKIYTIFNNTISIRIPNFPLILSLSHFLNTPFTATSSNISNEPSAWSGKEVIKIFQNQKFQPDLILDAGKLPKRPLSTIIDLTSAKIIKR